MRLTLPVAAFERLAKHALQFAGKGKDINPDYNLLHVELTDNGRLRISAQNAGAGAKVMGTIDDKKAEAGSVCLPSEQLDKIIGLLPSEKGSVLTITTGRGPKARIRSGKVQMSLPTRPAEDFPPLPKPPKNGWFDVTGKGLSEVIKRVLWAMCKDDTRPALAGVHLNDEVCETADGHMIARKTPGIVPKGQNVVIPGDAWNKLRSLIDDEKEILRMCIEDDRRVWLRSGKWAMFTTLIAHDFPSTKTLAFDLDGEGYHHIGDEKLRVHWIHLNRSETLAAVRRIAGASVGQEEKKIGAAVKFEVREGSLHLISHYPFEDVSNSILVDEVVDWGEGNVTADDITGFEALAGLGLYSTYMKMALESLSSDIVKFLWAEPLEGNFAPMQFHDDKVGMKSLVMPRKL